MTQPKLLVVDSNREAAGFLVDDLITGGYQVDSLRMGAEVLGFIDKQAVDCFIIDRSLEDMDSYRLCAAIRAKHQHKATPIIIISGLDDRDDSIDGLDAGVSDYIKKPFYYPVLAARVRNLLRIKDYQEQLEHARDEALQAKQSKSILLANMSHEIRTPLNGIIGLANLLSSSELTTEQAGRMKTLHSTAELLMELINNILDYSKFEQAHLQLEQIPFNLTEVVTGILNILSATIPDRKVTLATQISEQLAAQYIGDPSRLRQVLLNLLSNAVKFTSEGKITVAVEIIDAYTNSDRIRISVIDQGIGMDEDELSVLFEPYQQANAGIQRTHGGTGLGLAICKQIIEHMDGEIGVTSELGKGSCFWFEVTLAHSVMGKAPTISKPPELDITGMFQGRTILIVEDNPTNQLIVQSLLKKTQAKVVVANHGKEALQKLTEQPVDLILMDGQMPEMDGFVTTQMIRDDERYAEFADVPIIAMTASAFAGDEERCLAIGMDGYITKPVEPRKLYRLISRFISMSPVS